MTSDLTTSKLVTAADLRDMRDRWKENRSVVFTNGCFDILHAGHVYYLQEARKLGDVLVVGLNSDASVARLKGGDRPLQPAADRAYVLAGLACVDWIVIFNEETPENLITLFIPDILVKGGDYTPEEIVGEDVVTSSGGKVVTIPLLSGRSTSNIISKLK